MVDGSKGLFDVCLTDGVLIRILVPKRTVCIPTPFEIFFQKYIFAQSQWAFVVFTCSPVYDEQAII